MKETRVVLMRECKWKKGVKKRALQGREEKQTRGGDEVFPAECGVVVVVCMQVIGDLTSAYLPWPNTEEGRDEGAR